MMNQKVELLSPAGSFESLMAAIRGGADAVYFGVAQLNMRAKSIRSFTIQDLAEISAVCKQARVKTYLTLNTVMYDHDMTLIRNILSEVKKHGIDAVIASDFSVMEMCRQLQIPLHISTQANVSNVEALKFFTPFADVVVLARELSLKQVKHITSAIIRENIRGISGELMRVEVFAHGALCMAVSGKCYLSLHEQNASANRGACTQNCRRPYKVIDLETNNELVVDNEYIMSPKDLCTIDILDQLADAGVSVLKIEGRGRSADYVYTATKCYREALSALADGTYNQVKIAMWKQQLETVYNRGFWEGYYLGRKLGEWTQDPGSAATEKKIYVGKPTHYFPKIGVAEFLIEAGSLKQGDTVLVTGKHFGAEKLTLNDFRVNGTVMPEGKKGDMITFSFPFKTTRSDKLYKIVQAKDA